MSINKKKRATHPLTLDGFLTHQPPDFIVWLDSAHLPIPAPTKNPDLHQGYGFLAGAGIGQREMTPGLPVCITNLLTQTKWISTLQSPLS